MLSKGQRTAILELHAQKISKGEIARVLGVSRSTVRKVLRSQSSDVPALNRSEKAEPFREQILEEWANCKGNLVRVHEELQAAGSALSYPALTAFCRRHGIGQEPKRVSGQYHFEPGEEMQHDTSPHSVELNGKKRAVQTASAVLCYSRLLFFQCYPAFQRFDCKVFLVDALRYFGGSPARVMTDNTHVVVLRGTGRHMVPAPASTRPCQPFDESCIVRRTRIQYPIRTCFDGDPAELQSTAKGTYPPTSFLLNTGSKLKSRRLEFTSSV